MDTILTAAAPSSRWDYRTLTHPRIMEPLDVIKHVSSRFVLSAVAPVVDALPLEHSEEAFTSIIAAVANRTHTADQAVAAEISLVIAAGESAAPI